MPFYQSMPLGRKAEPFDHSEWIFELKYDGFRTLAVVEYGRCTLYSRNGHPFASFADLAIRIGNALMPRSLVMDGEIVCLDKRGHCQFNNLLFRRCEPRFIAFDLLHASGKDLRRERLVDRKHELRRIIANSLPPLIFADHIFESESIPNYVQLLLKDNHSSHGETKGLRALLRQQSSTKKHASELCVFCAQTVPEQGTKPAGRRKQDGISQCVLVLGCCCCLVCVAELEGKPNCQLEIPWPALSEVGVLCAYIRGSGQRKKTDSPAGCGINPVSRPIHEGIGPKRVCKIRMIEHVKDVQAHLGQDPLAKLGTFAERQVQIAEMGAAKLVSS